MLDLPAELIFQVIEDFVDDSSTLNATSLLCADFCFISQRILFNKIHITLPGADARKTVVKLHGLVSSPRLVSYIQDLALSLESSPTQWIHWNRNQHGVLVDLLHMISSNRNLRRFATTGIRNEFYYGIAGKILDAAKALTSAIDKICESPSLRFLDISSQTYLLLHRCSPSLIHLSASSTYGIPTDMSPYILGRETPVKLESLTSNYNFVWTQAQPVVQLDAYLLDPRNLVDLSSLKYLTYGSPSMSLSDPVGTYGYLRRILDSCHQSLVSFNLHSPGSPFDAVLNIRSLVNLRELTFQHWCYTLDDPEESQSFLWLARELSGPSSSPPTRLEKLTLVIHVSDEGLREMVENGADWGQASNPAWQMLSNVLEDRETFPYLQSITWRLERPSRSPVRRRDPVISTDTVITQLQTSGRVAQYVRRSMAPLNKLGILDIIWD